VSPVKYELGFYIPDDGFFIVTAVNTSNLTWTTASISISNIFILLQVYNGNIASLETLEFTNLPSPYFYHVSNY
jgi:hypothetical protein